MDTQITRLGGANFHEIPINAPLAAGARTTSAMACTARPCTRGRVAYEPNSLGGGCPFQAGDAKGFASFPQVLEAPDKLRGKPEKFADHYTQATLFYESQTAVEKAHLAGGFRFELSKLTVPAIRERMLASLVNVSPRTGHGRRRRPGHGRCPRAIAEACWRQPVKPEFIRVSRAVAHGTCRVTAASARASVAHPGGSTAWKQCVASPPCKRRCGLPAPGAP